MAADGVGAAQQLRHRSHVARRQGLTHGGARHPHPVHLVTHHAGDIEAVLAAQPVQQRVVALAARAEAEIVADQHVARAQPAHQYLLDEGLRRLAGQALVEAQHHDFLRAAVLQFGQLVAQGADARRREFGSALLAGEPVPRVRLEGQHAGAQRAVPGLVGQQCQHGLVPAVHAVEVADGHGAWRPVGLGRKAMAHAHA